MLNKQLFLAGEVKMIRLLILTISILGISVGSANADPKKVGFIYIGPPGDHGWTYMHDVGRQYMESQLGDSVTSTYIENCLLYTSPSPRDLSTSRMPSSA